MSSNEKSQNELSPLEALTALPNRRVSRRDLLGKAGQGVIGLTLFTLLSGSQAFADQRTSLERLLPGARELRPNGLGRPGTGPRPLGLGGSPSGAPNFISLPLWGDMAGWDQPQYYETLTVGDVDGDGQDELVVRGPNGLVIQRFSPQTGQWSDLAYLTDFSDANSWDQPQYYGTIRCGDIDGDGQAEVLGRAPDENLVVYHYNKTTFQFDRLPNGPLLDEISQGFDEPFCYSTLQCADIDGDGAAELIGRNIYALKAWKYSPSQKAWSALASNPSFGNFSWNDPQCYSTIQCADMDGDGRAEVIGRAPDGLQVWKYTGAGAWTAMYSGPGAILSDAGGWNQPQYYSTIQCADIDGDGKKELIANGVNGIGAWRFNSSTGEFEGLPNGPGWVWNAPQSYLTIRFGDIDGDGAEELIGRGGDGIQTWKFFSYGPLANTWQWLDGYNPSPQPAWTDDGTDGNGNAEADANGASWDEVQYYSTIRLARTLPDASAGLLPPNPHTAPTHDGTGGPRVGPYATLIGRDKYGVQTWRYQQKDNDREDGGAWFRTSAPFPDLTSTSADANNKAAYAYINKSLRGVDAQGEFRTVYYDLNAPLQTYYTNLKGLAPANIPAANWTAVQGQILTELQSAINVNSWYGEAGTIITDTFLSESLSLTTVGNLLGIPINNSTKTILSVTSTLLGAFRAITGVVNPVAGAALGVIGAAVSASSALLPNGGNPYQEEYNKLSDDLKNAFNAALTANGNAQAAAQDYGVLATIGLLVNEGFWKVDSDTQAKIVTAGQRSYEASLYKMLTPIVWEVGGNEGVIAHVMPSGYDAYAIQRQIQNPAGPYTQYFTTKSGKNKPNSIALSTLQRLFDQPTGTPPPLTDPLGQSFNDAMYGRNGWLISPNLSTDAQGAVWTPTPTPSLRVALARNATTGRITATITVNNAHFGPATSITNVRVVEARLGRVATLTALPLRPKRLVGFASDTVTLTFPAAAGNVGQTVVLRLSGKYKGGTFGGSFRVKLP